MLPIVLAGCDAEVPLPDVPVYGGTPEEQWLVHRELVAYDEAVGPGRVKLRRVDLVDLLSNHAVGLTDPVRMRIWLVRGQDSLTSTARHELCHALDAAEPGLAGADPVFDPLVSWLIESGEINSGSYKTEVAQRSETYAKFCAIGPIAAHALVASRCPGDPERGAEVGAWLTRHVYRAYELPDPILRDTDRGGGPPRLPPGTVTLDDWVEPAARITPAAGGGPVVVVAQDNEELAYDLYTGARLDTAGESVDGPEDSPILRGFYVEGRAGWLDGPAAAIGSPGAPFSIAPAARALGYDPDAGGWRLTGCADAHEDVFAADGTAWISWIDGPQLRWMPVAP